jgi:hypothetical protein
MWSSMGSDPRWERRGYPPLSGGAGVANVRARSFAQPATPSNAIRGKPMREMIALLLAFVMQRARGGRRTQAPLFLSSQSFGSQSSILLPSGSMIHANFPFSCDSGPWMIATSPARNCSSSPSRSSTR